MEEWGGDFWKRIGAVFATALFGLGALVWGQGQRFYDGRVHLIFCDVGQGEAILVRKNTDEILIDGGPGRKVLDCLSQNMPFWDRKIEVVVLTHPQADHLTGLLFVLKRYKVGYFLSSPVGNDSLGFKELKKLIEKKEVVVKNLFSGGKIVFGGIELLALWPQKNWLLAQVNDLGSILTGAKSGKGEAVLGASSDSNLNDFSLVFHLKYGQFDALLTADVGLKIQEKMMRTLSVPQVEVFKVPHHGSKTSLAEEFLEKARPKLAVISVGKNRWGHPAKETIERLANWAIGILRTDQEGEIEIISDGENFQVLTKRRKLLKI